MKTINIIEIILLLLLLLLIIIIINIITHRCEWVSGCWGVWWRRMSEHWGLLPLPLPHGICQRWSWLPWWEILFQCEVIHLIYQSTTSLSNCSLKERGEIIDKLVNQMSRRACLPEDTSVTSVNWPGYGQAWVLLSLPLQCYAAWLGSHSTGALFKDSDKERLFFASKLPK